MKFIPNWIRNGLLFAVARYFGFWADIVLRRWHPKTIVVTGSSGKTTLQNMLAFQFGETARVSGKFNSLFGVPFNILGVDGTEGNRWRWMLLVVIAPIKAFTVKYPQRYYIVEADANMPGVGAFLGSLLKPRITLWVSSGRTHSQYFDRLVEKKKFASVDEAIAAEFAEYAKHTSKILFTDGDNEDIANAIEEVADNLSLDKKEVALHQYSVDSRKTAFMLTNKRIYRFASPQPRQLGYQVVMMDKLLTSLRIDPRLDMTTMKQPPGRSTVLRGISDTIILDSTYNANLGSMKTIIDLFSRLEGSRKILVLGDMLEQGDSSAIEHKSLAHAIVQSDLRPVTVLLLGEMTKKYTKPVLDKYLACDVHAFSSNKLLLRQLQTSITGRETILFKGSQGQMLEGVIEQILANKADAKYLPRRSKLWQKRRAAHGLRGSDE